MKKLFITSTILFLVLTGCNTKQSKCNIDMFLGSLSEENKLTEGESEILLPFEKEKSLYLPQGNIITSAGTMCYNKPKTWVERLRGNLTKNNTKAILSIHIKEYLSELDLTSLAPKGQMNFDYIRTLAGKYDCIIGFNGGFRNSTSPYGFKCFSNSQEIEAYLADSILPKNPEGKILIAYDIPLKIQDAQIPPSDTNAIDTSVNYSVDNTPPHLQESGAKTVQEYFDKLSDGKVSYSAKKFFLASGMNKFFTGPKIQVVTLGANQTETASASISEFSESLRVTGQYYQFLRGDLDGQKYSKIYVKAK